MSGSFNGNNGNIGNNGNNGNNGNAGNASGSSSGWFFADRVNLPLVTESDAGPNQSSPPAMIGQLPIITFGEFRDRNWAPEWIGWVALTEFAQTNWKGIRPDLRPEWPAGIGLTGPVDWSALNAIELPQLVTAAQNERADALGEIVSQSSEFLSYLMNMMTARPSAYSQTYRVLTIASLVGTFVAMFWKARFKRPRPSQLCPALLPPLEVPGHASFPSGHSTQAHLMALSMTLVLRGLPQQATMIDDLWTLADRIARNREIAGLHYPSDSAAGVAIAHTVLPLLSPNPIPTSPQNLFQAALLAAREEWT